MDVLDQATDLVEEIGNAPIDVAEAVLGHVVKGDVARVNQRSDRLEKRPVLIDLRVSYIATVLWKNETAPTLTTNCL